MHILNKILHPIARLIFIGLITFTTPLFCEAPPPTSSSQEAILPTSLNADNSIQDFELLPLKQMSYWKEFFRMMMVLGAILGVVLVLAWYLRNFLNKRVKQVNENHLIKILERRSLSQKSFLYLIEVNNKQILVGESASGGIKFLTDCNSTVAPEAPFVDNESKELKPSFIEILQRKFVEKYSKPKIKP